MIEAFHRARVKEFLVVDPDSRTVQKTIATEFQQKACACSFDGWSIKGSAG